jgi:peptide/nickel transport system permease protein
VRYLARRFAFYVVTAWAAVTLNFLIPRLMPGDPVQALLSRFRGRLDPRSTDALTAMFGLNDDSMWSQYRTYLLDLMKGDFGLSFTFFPTPVSSVILSSLPWTIVLVGLSTIVSFVIGTLLGIVAGWRRGSWWDHLLPTTTFLSSIPYFWFGLIVLFVLSGELRWFPLAGGYSSWLSVDFSWPFLSSAFKHAVLPGLTIVVASVAGWLIPMRNMMVTTMADDYVVLAEAKGLSPRRVMLSYAARNAILPSVATFTMSLGFVVGGAVLTEIVFSYPGIGYTLYQAVINEDFPLMQGIFLIITFVVLLANFLGDLVYVALDPRTRVEA